MEVPLFAFLNMGAVLLVRCATQAPRRRGHILRTRSAKRHQTGSGSQCKSNCTPGAQSNRRSSNQPRGSATASAQPASQIWGTQSARSAWRRSPFDDRMRAARDSYRQAEQQAQAQQQAKESMRLTITAELQKVLGCHLKDRSLVKVLLALDVPVPGGLRASPEVVRSALKKAKFKYHPDKVQDHDDIRALVYAEEVIKILNSF